MLANLIPEPYRFELVKAAQVSTKDSKAREKAVNDAIKKVKEALPYLFVQEIRDPKTKRIVDYDPPSYKDLVSEWRDWRLAHPTSPFLPPIIKESGNQDESQNT
jgi:hypothetical protein